jgi:diketogulonate reductase-like aldo/keto reductase
LKRLELPAVHLLLIHWPAKAKVAPNSPENRKARIETWKAFEEIYHSGRAKSIGVSNFTITHLEQLVEDGAQIVPMVNQFELHVQLQQQELVKYCREHKIIAQAYSPFGGQDAPVLQLLQGYGQAPAAVALKAAGVLADSIVLKSGTPSRIQENFRHVSDSWELSTAELEEIRRLDVGYHYCWNPYTIAYHHLQFL